MNRPSPVFRRGVLFSALLLVACPTPIPVPDSGPSTPELPHCIPGLSAACGCTDGRTGAQVCTSEGVFEMCTCTGEAPGPTTGHCVPNQGVACYCSDLRMGAQLCRADGIYSPCNCPIPTVVDSGTPDAGPSTEVDAGHDEDAGVVVDSGTPDSGVTIDAGVDAGPITLPDGGISYPGCNLVDGIECDGDWAGQCNPGCGGQCCSPYHGTFTCLPRDQYGNCPRADLWVDQTRVLSSFREEYVYFDPSDCALVEGCVDGPGLRRLLRFDTRTPNSGTADMFLGQPSMSNPWFEYAQCHGHYHFESYSNYELLNDAGMSAANGHKQAFCLEDLDRYDPLAPASHYTCSNQGIQVGWADVYTAGLDCQWIDITNVDAGTYNLRISLNTQHILLESNYTNNVITVPVTIGAPNTDETNGDPTVACTSSQQGAARQCGWTADTAPRTCTPDTLVRVGCSAACGLGMCTGDSMLRVYEGDRTDAGSIVTGVVPLQTNDDSHCAVDGGGNDLCSLAAFNCPESGQYTVLTAPYFSNGLMTCTLATIP